MTDTPDESESTGVTRRRVLGGAAAAAGLGAASMALPPNLRRALASPPPKLARLSDIKHVVLLMQENRSFDHYFGTLSGVRGFGYRHAIRQANGRSVFYQNDPQNPDGYLLPYRLNAQQTAAQAIPSTSHAWSVQHQAWNYGRMDNWVPAHRSADGQTKGPYTMGYFTRDDVPFHYALADAFTVMDGYHCSVLGPTHPNRYMWLTGTIDPDGLAGGPALDNKGPNGAYSWTTYPERLEAAGVSWKFYHLDANDPLNSEGGPTGPAVLGKMQQYMQAATDPTSALYRKALAPSPYGQFEYDALNDQLPTVSWLFPPGLADEHPARLPAAGARFVAGKIDAIAANPEVWAKTVFLLTYDENDGLFDHVPPAVPRAGTPGEYVTKNSPGGTVGGGLPVGPGFRVPALVVSPWTVGGWVCSELSDHTSMLRFLERVTGVPEPNISAYRRHAMGDLTSAFRFGHRTREAPVLPDTGRDYSYAQYAAAHLPAAAVPTRQEFPRQERGNRPRLP